MPISQVTLLPETPSQTGGPYVHIGLAPLKAGIEGIFATGFGNNLVAPETKGERIRIEGMVYDGSGTVLKDVLMEIWQANAAGKFNSLADTQDKPIDPAFRGWGRTSADFDTGLYSFETIKPGSVPAANGRLQAPHISLALFARGINIGLHTRIYFDDEQAANEKDPVLNGIEWAVRRPTLIARRTECDGKTIYRFDVRIQNTPDGGQETVFFDI